jgi:hypothetical protein
MLKRRQQEAAERRRVWSAPISSAAPSLRTTANNPEDVPDQLGVAAQLGAADLDATSPAAASPARPGLQGDTLWWWGGS